MQSKRVKSGRLAISELRLKADEIRREVVDIAITNGAGHIAPSLSCVDILVALYYRIMIYDTNNTQWDGRDRLIFSKSHGCYGLYAILADLGIMPRDVWRGLYRQGNELGGCAERQLKWGIEAGCGSLGHGLPLAVGIAWAAKYQRRQQHCYCVMGDGETQEGTTWEALQFAVKHGLNNLTIIIDRNRLQAMDFVSNIMDRSEFDIIHRFEGFGTRPVVCDGHDTSGLAGVIADVRTLKNDVPGVVIANTIKGYGVKCMENVAKFHFRVPTDDDMRNYTQGV